MKVDKVAKLPIPTMPVEHEIDRFVITHYRKAITKDGVEVEIEDRKEQVSKVMLLAEKKRIQEQLDAIQEKIDMVEAAE